LLALSGIARRVSKSVTPAVCRRAVSGILNIAIRGMVEQPARGLERHRVTAIQPQRGSSLVAVREDFELEKSRDRNEFDRDDRSRCCLISSKAKDSKDRGFSLSLVSQRIELHLDFIKERGEISEAEAYIGGIGTIKIKCELNYLFLLLQRESREFNFPVNETLIYDHITFNSTVLKIMKKFSSPFV